jgi:hypothetical protein
MHQPLAVDFRVVLLEDSRSYGTEMAFDVCPCANHAL